MPNGERYPLVGEVRQRAFAGISFEPYKLLENAQTPTSRVHALLACLDFKQGYLLQSAPYRIRLVT